MPALCQCGCGQPAPIAKQTRSDRGYVKGQPQRFVKGHSVCTTTLFDAFSKGFVAGEAGECWEWQGSRHENGYGYVSFANKKLYAHRVSYMIHVGPIPDGLDVCHSCDNPPCTNPEHLYPGTRQDNVDDMVRKGRNPRGEDNKTSKLTNAQVREIRRAHSAGSTQTELAHQYGVALSTVNAIIKGRSWKYTE